MPNGFEWELDAKPPNLTDEEAAGAISALASLRGKGRGKQVANNSTATPAAPELYRYILYSGRWVIETVRSKRFVGAMGPGENAKRDAAALVHAANNAPRLQEALREAYDWLDSYTSGDTALRKDVQPMMVRIEYLLRLAAHVTQ